MSYSERLTYYRNQFKKYLDARDTSNAKLYAMLYSKLLREISGQINSYADRAKLAAEAEKYDLIAAMITRYGITAAVKKAIAKGETSIPPTAGKKKDEPASLPEELPEESESSREDADWGADVFERSLPATLIVMTESGIGTGFFVTSDGYFITNHHVIHNGSKRETYITVESGDGKIKCEAEFVKADKARDVALLRLKDHRGKTPFLPLVKDYSQVRPGIAMMLIGNGLNFGLAPSAGNVKFTHSKSDGDLVYTAPSNNGDSGAPVFNKDGECIGIHKSATVGQVMGNTQIRVTGLSNATPAEDIRKLLSKWGLEGKI